MPSTCYISELDLSDQTFLDAYPAIYNDAPPERRASAHQTQDGQVYQDFGFEDSDWELSLRCDKISMTNFDALKLKHAVVGKVWRWHDEYGNDYNIFFRRLSPRRIQGNNAYIVEMVFAVLEIL